MPQIHQLISWVQQDPKTAVIVVLCAAIFVIAVRAWFRASADRRFHRLFGFVPHRLGPEQQQALVSQKLEAGLGQVKQMRGEEEKLERQLEDLRSDIAASERLQRERLHAARRRGFVVEKA